LDYADAKFPFCFSLFFLFFLGLFFVALSVG
jgi:hypothetical protein